MKNFRWNLLKSLAAGIMIAIGGTVYLSCTNKVVGAILFSLGLFTICVFGMHLFTGKIGYIFASKNDPNCAVIWLGNLCGTVLAGVLIRFSLPSLAQTAAAVCSAKLDIPLWRVLILAVFCGVLMYIAVHNFKINADPFGRYIGIFLCVPVFILCGFEHSIADMFYLSLFVSTWNDLLRSVLFLLVVTLGNAIGGISVHFLFGTKKDI